MEIKKDDRQITPEELSKKEYAKILSIKEVINLLASPDAKLPLQFSQDTNYLTDGIELFELRNKLPLLIPTKLYPFYTDKLQVPFTYFRDSFLQYFLLA